MFSLFPGHLRSQGFVMTLQFILFLYIQQIHKISFKASLVLGGEEYPEVNIIIIIIIIIIDGLLVWVAFSFPLVAAKARVDQHFKSAVIIYVKFKITLFVTLFI